MSEPVIGLDEVGVQCAKRIVNGIEQRMGCQIWNTGLGQVIEEFVRQNVPAYSPTDLARVVGILRAPGTRPPRRVR